MYISGFEKIDVRVFLGINHFNESMIKPSNPQGK